MQGYRLNSFLCNAEFTNIKTTLVSSDRFAVEYSLQTFPPPIALDGFDIAMAWQSRMDNDRPQQWLRSEFIAIAEMISYDSSR
ncbi:MAG: hypothetical protein NW214_11275 [Pseudanabaenaceae cyanobacterium bins.39]|nr:hypothetical protein [Pseudanabaenaceae cyanobacterium bins.39]